jgi:hypothetical protein
MSAPEPVSGFDLAQFHRVLEGAIGADVPITGDNGQASTLRQVHEAIETHCADLRREYFALAKHALELRAENATLRRQLSALAAGRDVEVTTHKRNPQNGLIESSVRQQLTPRRRVKPTKRIALVRNAAGEVTGAEVFGG